MKTQTLQIRIEQELLDSLTKLAKSNALSLSSQLRMLIKKAVSDDK